VFYKVAWRRIYRQCGGLFNSRFIANFLENISLNKKTENRLRFNLVATMSLVSQFSWDSVYYKYKSGLHWELIVATSWSERHVSSFAAWENEFDAVLRGQIC